MIVVPFQSWHFWDIKPQASQAYVQRFATNDGIEALEKHASYTCMVDDAPVCCFGYMELYPTRASIWSYMSEDAAPHFIRLTKIAHRFIKSLPHKRLEMEVDAEFEQGHRWARMLGFTLEAECLRGYRMDGGDSAIYARVRA